MTTKQTTTKPATATEFVVINEHNREVGTFPTRIAAVDFAEDNAVRNYEISERPAGLKSFAHNGYNGGRRTAASFRIGYTEYRVWTLAGFWRDELVEFAAQVQANVTRVLAAKPGEPTGMPNFALNLPAYCATEATYIAEQLNRSHDGALRGASPQGSMITNDREANARRADAFRALPEIAFNDRVMIDGVECTAVRAGNDHIRFMTDEELAARDARMAAAQARVGKSTRKAGR